MDDLISRSALLKKKTRMTEYDETGCGVHVIVVRADDIENAPAVDAEPVRHGRWVEKGMSHNMLSVWECSKCGFTLDGIIWPYCPNCGANMDGGANDD